MRHSMNRMVAAAVLAVCAVALVSVSGAVSAQEHSQLERMMQMNRSGEWDAAARLAQSFLDSGGRKTLAQRCEGLYSLTYSQTRLGRVAEAQTSLSTYRRTCAGLARGHWLQREVARLGEELSGKPSEAPRPRGGDGFWKASGTNAVGAHAPLLVRHRELCLSSGADACLVVHKGKIVQETYSPGYGVPAYAMSSTKSITGLLVGMLIDDGKIKSIDEPVCSYINEWCAGRKARVTIRHLLSMTSGLPKLKDKSVGRVADKNPFVIALPLAHEPGAAWEYSNEGVQLLSPLLDKAAGEPVQDYARRRLFEPLGMSDTRLHLDEKGHAWTYADMETTPRDLARIGVLMLNKGVWQGRRILSEAWVEQSTRPSQALNPHYGLLWWLYDSPRGYAALGHLETNLYVFPERELIVVRMQSKPAAGKTPYEREALPLFGQLFGR